MHESMPPTVTFISFSSPSVGFFVSESSPSVGFFVSEVFFFKHQMQRTIRPEINRTAVGSVVAKIILVDVERFL